MFDSFLKNLIKLVESFDEIHITTRRRSRSRDRRESGFWYRRNPSELSDSSDDSLSSRGRRRTRGPETPDPSSPLSRYASSSPPRFTRRDAAHRRRFPFRWGNPPEERQPYDWYHRYFLSRQRPANQQGYPDSNRYPPGYVNPGLVNRQDMRT
jgi:hypothetical protein